MNILFVSLDFPPTVGGIAAHVFELSKALRERGNVISVITRKLKQHKRSEARLDGVPVFRLPLRGAAPVYGWQINRFVQKKLPRIKPEVIHIHGMAPLEGYRIKDIPLVYTNHTSGYLKRIQKGGFRRMLLLKRLFRKPDLFLAPSRELLEIPFPIRAPKQFIPNGVDAGKYKFNPAAREKIRKQLGLTDQDVVGILTRRLVPKNGVIFMAKATQHIQNKRLKLILIGDGPERPAIQETLSRHFRNRYFMLGSKEHDEIIAYYSAADFSVLPSLMEATSISGLEAMAASLPLVGTHVGGIPELIDISSNGFLCRPADEMDLAQKIDMLLDGDLKRYGASSRKRVEENFSWNRIAQKTQEAYESLL